MTNEELKKEFENFLIKNISFNIKKRDADFQTVLGKYALRQARNILSKRGDIHSEARESISVAQKTILEKLQKGEFSVDGELDNPDAFWMSQYTSHIVFYLLKRKTRRSNTKSKERFDKEVENSKDPTRKPSKYSGARFEEFGSTHSDAMTDDFKEPIPTTNELRQLLEGKGIKADVIEILLLKASGEKYEAIGEKLGITKDAVRMKFNRAVKEHGIDKSLLK
jgi:hypothetical protein